MRQFLREGTLVDKDSVMETIVPAVQTRGASTSGGKWTSGSGYAICTGLKVSGNSGLIGLQISYKVDFQHVQGGYDKFDRIYSTEVDGLGNWTYLDNTPRVMRPRETLTYSAYDGVKGQWTVTMLGVPAGTSTKHLYFRVGNDRFWLDPDL